MRNYQRSEVIYKLTKSGIKIIDGIIVIPKKTTVGIKTWGILDFLKIPVHRKDK